MDFVFYRDSNRACVQIVIRNDFLVESLYETFFVDFSSVSHPRQVLFDQNRATVVIKDIDRMFLNNPVQHTLMSYFNSI